MLNVYSFLYFTLSLSVLAAFLLLVKEIFQDKLSPRWQYGVWSMLALRMVLPLTGTGKELTSALQFLLETGKNLVEPTITSAYTQLSEVTKVLFPLPWFTKAPASITDWLFVIYAAGFWLTLLWYAASYLRLRLLLKRGRPASEAVLERLSLVCEANKLHRCDVVEVDGLPSAFICGIAKPLLVIPADSVPEDAVLLHELLHLRYKDALQNLFWCFFKALNWCNPFLRYVCRQIGNDQESLCDQRVLERLSGEARREYGMTLLSMANERYPRAPGTTSLSNGGAFIAKRIEAIVRFKRYPQGMSVVSVCLCILLAVTFIFGNMGSSTLYDSPQYLYGSTLDQAMAYASARLYRCTTLAGALDTYAKGLINENILQVAAASPLKDQQALLRSERTPWLATNDWQYSGSGDGYTVYNLFGTQEGLFTGQIVYEVGPAESDPPPPQDTMLDWYAIYPFTAYKSGDRWVVEGDGTPWRQAVTGNDLFQLPWMTEYRAEGESGIASVFLQIRASIDNRADSDSWGNSSFNHAPIPDATFSHMMLNHRYRFECTVDPAPLFRATMLIQCRETADETVAFVDHSKDSTSPYVTGSSTDGTSSISQTVFPTWDGVLEGGGGRGYGGNDIENEDFTSNLPYDYIARIVLNGKPIEDLYLKEVRK